MLLAVLVLIPGPFLLAGPQAATEPAPWQAVGLSGGGAMFSPAISPCDGRLMMVNCDMSAAYISSDGGANWRMIHYSQLRSNTQCRPAFHPTDSIVIAKSNFVLLG